MHEAVHGAVAAAGADADQATVAAAADRYLLGGPGADSASRLVNHEHAAAAASAASAAAVAAG